MCKYLGLINLDCLNAVIESFKFFSFQVVMSPLSRFFRCNDNSTVRMKNKYASVVTVKPSGGRHPYLQRPVIMQILATATYTSACKIA